MVIKKALNTSKIFFTKDGLLRPHLFALNGGMSLNHSDYNPLIAYILRKKFFYHLVGLKSSDLVQSKMKS